MSYPFTGRREARNLMAKALLAEALLDAFCVKRNIHKSIILGKNLKRDVTAIRQEAMHEVYEGGIAGRWVLAYVFNRDPSTIKHGIEAHRRRTTDKKALPVVCIDA